MSILNPGRRGFVFSAKIMALFLYQLVGCESNDGKIHLGKNAPQVDSNGLRTIDSVLSSYIQGICRLGSKEECLLLCTQLNLYFCSDFKSEHESSCTSKGFSWFKCPEDFPHADSKVRNGMAHIPVCYTDRQYSLKGYGPPGSW